MHCSAKIAAPEGAALRNQETCRTRERERHAQPMPLHNVKHPSPGPGGGAGRDRTDDLLLAKQALSRLSYGPEGPDSGGPG